MIVKKEEVGVAISRVLYWVGIYLGEHFTMPLKREV